MGNHRDNRKSRGRGRGFDADQPSFGDPENEPSYFQRSQTVSSSSSSSPPIDAEVMWFNADKGFGFVKAADGTEAFLHISALEAAGSGAVSEGAQVKVRLQDGAKGKQVGEILEIRAGAAPASSASSAPRPPRPAPRGSAPDGPEQEGEGTVKWYNPDKGFGFIGLDSGEKDVFVHVTALNRSGLTALEEGQKVVVRYAQGQKGLEARSIQPA